MKTLKNHTLIYDADCPLCRAYTGAFIATGFLDNGGRTVYQQVGGGFAPEMDAQLSQDEIALVDMNTGKVRYGLESLLFILSQRFPLLIKILSVPGIRNAINVLYKLISYNRKVIAPAPANREHRFTCTPSFNLKYRWAYIIISWIVTSILLSAFTDLFIPFVSPGSVYRELVICGGQIAFQAAAVSLVTRSRRMEYLGNMMTVSLIGSLLLIPAIIIGGFLAVPAFIWLIYFTGVVTYMLYEHMRRMQILDLGIGMSLSWVLYRTLVLVVLAVNSFINL
jgi:hypothetical protein